MIASTLPPRLNDYPQKLAIDLVLIPYYGDEETEDICRSQAKKSTTKFFCYANAYVIKKNKRVTLCFTFVRPSDTLFDVLKKVLAMVFPMSSSLRPTAKPNASFWRPCVQKVSAMTTLQIEPRIFCGSIQLSTSYPDTCVLWMLGHLEERINV